MLKLNFFSDKQIIKRIQSNDRTVLAEVYEQHEAMTINYLINHGGNRDDAEDALQEAVIILWQKVTSGQFNLSAKLSTYMMGIVKNKWFEELRRRKTGHREFLKDEEFDGNPGLLDVMIDDEQKTMLHNAIGSLTEVCRKILLAFYFEQRSMEEIAGLMSFAGADVVKSKKYQCKKALEKLVKQQFVEKGE